MSSGSSTAGTARPSLAAMGAQHAAQPANAAEAQARYFNSANAFNVKLPAVPAQAFTAQAAAALDAASPTGWWACDQSPALGGGFPATTPLMLARYARIRAGETLAADFCASGLIYRVIEGRGWSRSGGEELRWAAGDVLFLAGGQPWLLGADAGQDAVLWAVTDEPLYALCRARPVPAALPTVHYRADDIARQLDAVHAATPEAGNAGLAVVFSSAALEAGRNILPTLTLSLNSLPSGADQAPHRHNSAAITLVVRGEHCHTRIDGTPCAWQPWATLVTPPGAAHSHHNRGSTRAEFLIVQDGGLHYHARTMGFAFLDQNA
ncbi:cupin domain-containing protein [Xylophilus sp. GW821-FHT01B05]